MRLPHEELPSGPSINSLKVWLAQYACNINPSSRPLEDYPIVSGPEPVEVLLIPL